MRRSLHISMSRYVDRVSWKHFRISTSVDVTYGIMLPVAKCFLLPSTSSQWGLKGRNTMRMTAYAFYAIQKKHLRILIVGDILEISFYIVKNCHGNTVTNTPKVRDGSTKAGRCRERFPLHWRQPARLLLLSIKPYTKPPAGASTLGTPRGQEQTVREEAGVGC